MTNKIFLFVYVLIVFSVNFNYAQENQVSIQLLDDTIHEPIIGAVYRFDSQQGTSDLEGKIQFVFNETDTLHLSHIS